MLLSYYTQCVVSYTVPVGGACNVAMMVRDMSPRGVVMIVIPHHDGDHNHQHNNDPHVFGPRGHAGIT